MDESANQAAQATDDGDARANRPGRLARVQALIQTAPHIAVIVCAAPVLFALAIPTFPVQVTCVIWGVINLVVLSRIMLLAREMRSDRRLVISFAAVIAVTQTFGSAYAATLLSHDAHRHFRFSPYSSAADYNNRRLAAEILADSYASGIRQVNLYVEAQIGEGSDQPTGYPFDTRLKRRPCPNAGIALFIFYFCESDPPFSRTADQEFQAERLFDALFEQEAFSDEMWILRTADPRQSVVAALSPLAPKETFFENAGGALLTYFYRLETEQRSVPTRSDRRASIEHLSDIAKTTLREYGPDATSLLPNDILAYGGDIPRIEYAIADTLICLQYAMPDYFSSRCEPVGEFAQFVSEEGWDAQEARSGVLLSALRPLDLVLQTYLTEILYWDMKSMETTADRRDMVINGYIFSAMAVMTSGFSDMSPMSYLAKSLLILQFLAYVILIILILPMSFERPKEEL